MSLSVRSFEVSIDPSTQLSYAQILEHDISGDLLLELDANLLKELDIPQFGKRLRIAQAISELRRPASVMSGSSQIVSPGLLPPSSSTGLPRGIVVAPVHTPDSASTPTTSPMLPSADGSVSHAAWAHGRKPSTSTVPQPMDPISEIQPQHTATPTLSSTSASVPTSPATPTSVTTKRESVSSLGHKKGKPSLDQKDRLSFFGRSRKPAPT
jgi:hypothetical protein